MVIAEEDMRDPGLEIAPDYLDEARGRRGGKRGLGPARVQKILPGIGARADQHHLASIGRDVDQHRRAIAQRIRDPDAEPRDADHHAVPVRCDAGGARLARDTILAQHGRMPPDIR